MHRHLSFSHPSFLDHGVKNHPENSSRLSSIFQAFLCSPFHNCLDQTFSRKATKDELALVHTPQYIDKVLLYDGQTTNLDLETVLTPGSVNAALIAAGLGIELVERVIDGKISNGFALLRPPGHHARPSAAMGFCVFNNIAIAAKAALSQGLKRILIFDWDVHHGNGTQEAFYDDDRVMFIDIHQDNLFPARSGNIQDIGSEKGKGYTVNCPLPEGCRDVDYLYVFNHLVTPIAEEFHPELILVSAGFDAHESDPLGGMSLTTQGFVWLMTKVRLLAEKLCHGKVVLFLEGGYDPAFLAKNVLGCVQVLAQETMSNCICADDPQMFGLKHLIKDVKEYHDRQRN